LAHYTQRDLVDDNRGVKAGAGGRGFACSGKVL